MIQSYQLKFQLPNATFAANVTFYISFLQNITKLADDEEDFHPRPLFACNISFLFLILDLFFKILQNLLMMKKISTFDPFLRAIDIFYFLF